jgi:hypothetical protein
MRVALLMATFVTGVSCCGAAMADSRSDAQRLIEFVDRQERLYKPLCEMQPSPRLSPKKREAFLNLVSREEALLNTLPLVRLYAKKIELGDRSRETFELLNTFWHRFKLAENEVEEAARALRLAR